MLNISNLESRQQELLKIIALVLMTVDHIGAYFFNGYNDFCMMTLIGRIVFPLFAYLLVYNYIYHSKDKKMYVAKLFLFGAIAQLFYPQIFHPLVGEYDLNVLFTLGSGIGYLYLAEILKPINKTVRYLTLGIAMIALLVTALHFFDASIIGLFLIWAFYFYIKEPNALNLITLLGSIFLLNQSTSITYGLAGLLSMGLIYYFNNTKLGIKRYLKSVWFYVYYPLHLLVLLVFGYILL